MLNGIATVVLVCKVSQTAVTRLRPSGLKKWTTDSLPKEGVHAGITAQHLKMTDWGCRGMLKFSAPISIRVSDRDLCEERQTCAWTHKGECLDL